jgi:FkbM family methyltransferase
LDTLELLELLPSAPKKSVTLGPNIGTWTALAKSIFPRAAVFVFEALEFHCEEYVRTSSTLEHVTLHSIALDSTAGRIEVQIPTKSDAASNAGSREAFNLAHERSVTVERMDDYARIHNIPSPI